MKEQEWAAPQEIRVTGSQLRSECLRACFDCFVPLFMFVSLLVVLAYYFVAPESVIYRSVSAVLN